MNGSTRALPAVRQIAASGLLVVALLVGCTTAVRALRAEHTALKSVASAPRVNGRLAIFHDSRDEFIDFVRNIVPAGAPIRILQQVRPNELAARPGTGPPGVCGNQVDGARYWLLIYDLLPRPSVCEGARVWTIYFGVPIPLGKQVHRFSATMGVQTP